MDTLYITKWALTKGILRAPLLRAEDDGGWLVQMAGFPNERMYVRFNDGYLSLQSAQDRAKAMARARRQALAKEDSKLERIERVGVEVQL